jgi:hypothetical protein
MALRMALKKAFEVTLGSNAGNLFFEVPFDVRAFFGKARPPVKVSLARHRYRSTIAVYGGRSFVPVRRDHREAAGVKVGDTVAVVLELDTEPRIVAVPPALRAALAKDRVAKAAWQKLSYSHQREHAQAIVDAKKPETRQRRVARTLAMLKGGR